MHHELIDRYAHESSPIHALDPRAKLLATLAFTIAVVTSGKFEVLGLIPFVTYPVAILALAGIPIRFALRQALIVSPFIVLVAAMNPVFDRAPIVLDLGVVEPIAIRRGFVSLASVLVKFLLTVTALVALVGTTPFAALVRGAEGLGCPQSLSTPLQFVYRYIFVLLDQVGRMMRARAARDAGAAPLAARLAGSGGIAGALFVRTLDRAERIYYAMRARGYDGRMPVLARLSFRARDGLFAAATLLYCGLVRALAMATATAAAGARGTWPTP